MEDGRTIKRSVSIRLRASPPSSIWISMNEERGHETDRRVRRQAAKASNKARLLTISQRPRHGKYVKGSMVWELTDQAAPLGRRNLHSRRPSDEPQPVFGVLRSQTPRNDDRVYSSRLWHGSVWLDPLDTIPIDKSSKFLIHHFMQHFAPEPFEGQSLRGREALRLELWPAMMESPPLLSSMLLVLATHYNICVFADPGAQNVDALTLKAAAISNIKNALAISASSFPNAYNVGAIALIAGWELEYGDPAVYELHMRFLQKTVQAMGIQRITDATSCEQCALPRVIHQLLTNVGFELAVYASRQPYISLPSISGDIMQRQPTGSSHWPRSFVTAVSQHIVVPRLLQLLAQLGEPFDTSLESCSSLSVIFKQLEAWDPYKATGSAYCFFQTQMEDDVNAQAHYSLRAAGLAMCWSIWHGLQTQFDQTCSTFEAGTFAEIFSLDLFTAQCSQWQPDVLIGTVFEDMTTWALFMTCLVSDDLGRCFQTAEGDFESLRVVGARSAMRNGLTTAASIKDILQKYVVPCFWSNPLDRCKALLEELELGQNGQIHLDTWNRHNTAAPRYDRHVHYPTTIIEPG